MKKTPREKLSDRLKEIGIDLKAHEIYCKQDGNLTDCLWRGNGTKGGVEVCVFSNDSMTTCAEKGFEVEVKSDNRLKIIAK